MVRRCAVATVRQRIEHETCEELVLLTTTTPHVERMWRIVHADTTGHNPLCRIGSP